MACESNLWRGSHEPLSHHGSQEDMTGTLKKMVGQRSLGEDIGSRNVGWLSSAEESVGNNGEVSKLMGGTTYWSTASSKQTS